MHKVLTKVHKVLTTILKLERNQGFQIPITKTENQHSFRQIKVFAKESISRVFFSVIAFYWTFPNCMRENFRDFKTVTFNFFLQKCREIIESYFAFFTVFYASHFLDSSL